MDKTERRIQRLENQVMALKEELLETLRVLYAIKLQLVTENYGENEVIEDAFLTLDKGKIKAIAERIKQIKRYETNY
ncbi:hypothetical protein V2H45_05845 [Tumidithrix elongata RA019]|uniref:Uncharacterized protein n=1 Tax=Tumidithrix elongata BACA0141 TaxID=2716417 RepID=A0AAW9Q0F9_9CYAN|nr:hypothetical protein [Tumidithrix elongata RA019]